MSSIVVLCLLRPNGIEIPNGIKMCHGLILLIYFINSSCPFNLFCLSFSKLLGAFVGKGGV